MEISVQKKPTKHSTPCSICKGEITKGDYRVILRSCGYHSQDSAYMHVWCLRAWLDKEIRTLSALTKDTAINPSRRDIHES
jgi:hypothetical protein